jgi:hypothetical protein
MRVPMKYKPASTVDQRPAKSVVNWSVSRPCGLLDQAIRRDTQATV